MYANIKSFILQICGVSPQISMQGVKASKGALRTWDWNKNVFILIAVSLSHKNVSREIS